MSIGGAKWCVITYVYEPGLNILTGTSPGMDSLFRRNSPKEFFVTVGALAAQKGTLRSSIKSFLSESQALY